MKQETFTDIEYSFRKKKTRREEFLEIMDEIIPLEEWVDEIKPYYPAGKRGRPPMGSRKCYGCIYFRSGRSGSTCRTQPPRMLFTIAMPCGNSRVSTS